MKFKYHSRFIALVVIVSMLLSCMIMPVAVTAAAESFDSAIKTMASDDSLTDNETLFSDETAVLRSDDPIIKDSSILHYVDSAQFDNARHTVRLSELEDLNTYVFQNADGTRTVYLLDEDVKYVNSEGKTVEKNLSLLANKQGYEITQSNIGLTMSNNPRDGIHLDYLGHTVTITPVTQNTDTIAVKKNNSIVYTDIFGSNVSLKYTPLLSGVKEDIILPSYIPNASYSFTLDTDGLYVCEKDHKYFLAESADGKPLLYLGDVIIYDAIGKPSEGTMTVKTISAGSEYTVTVAADEAFLSDPTTVYPVTIDPSITISDNDNGSNAIEDSPIYAGFSNRNFGAYFFNPVGTPDSTFGIGRTVVRLSGLINSSIYKDLNSSQITKVTFNATEGSGTATQYINLYPLTGNTTWTESTVTWNNIGSYTTAVNYGASMKGGQCAAFDITGLVRAWKNKTYSPDAGFIMVSQNEAVNKGFCSSEYSTTSYRPYVVITYNPDISLNYTSTSIVEGGTRTLVATTKPSGQSVTWSTSNSSVATVSSSGVVTAKKAGTATITASITDSDGIKHSASCTVYVYIANGVYYIKNLNSNLCLNVENGGIAILTNVCQYSKYSDTYLALYYRIRQMWKTYYLGNGRYSIRPMNKLDMGLDVTNKNVDIYNIGTTDTLSSIPSYGEWSINWYSTGYVFKNNGSDSLTMQIEDASTSLGATVVASTYSTSLNCRWELTKISSPPSGLYLYDTSINSIILTDNTITRYVAPEESRTLSEMSLKVVSFDASTNSQTFTWTPSSEAFLSVNGSGTVTGKKAGTTTVTAKKVLSGVSYSISFTVKTTEIANGTYFLENKKTEKYSDIEDQLMNSGTQIHQWELHGGNTQRWTFTHLGDGYYSIKSENSASNYYMGVSEDSTDNDAPIVLRTGSLTNGMKWKISKTTSGAYKITPKTGEANNRVLAIGWYIASTNGIDIQQCDYVDDSDYKDEWLLHRTGTETMLLSIISTDGSHDHISCYCDAMRSFESTNYNTFNVINTNYITATDCISQMELSDIFISRSHGGYNSDCTFLRLFDTGIESRLYSYNIYDFSTSTALVNFDGVEMMLYVGCTTAYNGNTGRNLVTASVNAGANYALGFQKSINCDGANTWTSYFCQYYTAGQTIFDAAQHAAEDTALEHPVLNGIGQLNTDSYVIAH